MKFCPECNFLLYYAENEENGLINRCKNCGYEKKSDDVIISTTIYKKNGLTTSRKSKKYYKYDNAYPRTHNYDCPNEQCPTKKDDSLKDAILINDALSLKLIYICAVCDIEWK